MRGTTGLAVLAGVLAWASGASAGTITLSDGEFASTDWSTTVLSAVGTGTSGSGTQDSVLGNPVSSWMVVHTLAAGSAQVFTFHEYTAASYDPATAGAIDSIDMTVDTIQTAPPFPTSQGNAVRIALRQGSTVYVSNVSVLTSEIAWQQKQILAMTAAQFMAFGAAGSPDFSTAGSPITFGWVAGNTTSTGNYSIQVNYDNWLLNIKTVPDPASTGWLLLLSIGLLALAKRQLGGSLT